jgi:protein required for attachment to host cells
MQIWNSAGKSLKKGKEMKTVMDVCEFNWEREERLKQVEQNPQSIEEQKRILKALFAGIKTKKRL